MAISGQNPTGQNSPQDDFNQVYRNISSFQLDFAESMDSALRLKNALKDTSKETGLLFQNSTAIKNNLAETLSLAAKLGTEYINQAKIKKREEATNALLQAQLKIKEEYETKIGVNLAGSLEKINRAIALEKKGLIVKKGYLSLDEARYYTTLKNIEGLNNTNKSLEEIKKSAEAGNKEFEKTQLKATAIKKIFNSISGIPFLKDFMNFEKIADAFDPQAGGSMIKGFKSLGSEILRVVKSPLFLLALGIMAAVSAFKSLIKLAFDYDKIVTDIANNTALSKTSAVGMLDAYRDISNQNLKLVDSLNSGYLSVKNQANALIELGSTLETNAMFTNEMVQNQIVLTKQMKMSAEEAAGIQKFSLLTGQSAEKILNTAMKQNTTVISYRKIFSQIAKINSELAVAYKNNPELIAKAVVQANKLGMSLEDTQKISKSLLDFENSIAGELEAELLLGKQFNFEKARALALDGKSAEAAAELVGQMGGLNALTNMNVIQRERLAASIGLSAEELTKSAREQAVLNALGEQNRAGLEERYEYLRKTGDIAGLEQLKAEAARKEGGQALLQDIARANLQDRFNESMERIKQIFTEIAAGPMIKLISGFAKMLEDTTMLKVIMVSLTALAGAIAASMIIATGGLAAVGAVVGGGVALAAMGGVGASSAGASDMAVAPLPNRTLPTSNTTTAGGGASGNDAMLKAIQDLHDTVKKGSDVNMDGIKVGTVTAMSSRKSAK
jgi:hypothetical protein